MALPEPLKSMCRHTVRIEAFAGTNVSGARSYSTGNDYPARIVGKRQIVRANTGAEVVSNTTIYVATDIQIDPKSRLTLPSGSYPSANTSQPVILAVAYF